MSESVPSAKAKVRFSPRSLQTTLVALIAVILLIVGLIISLVTITALNRDLIARVDEQLRVSLTMTIRDKDSPESRPGPGGELPQNQDQQGGPGAMNPSGGPRLGSLEVITVGVDSDPEVQGQIVTSDGTVRDLTTDEIEAINSAVAEGRHEVTVDDIGTYRLLSATGSAGGGTGGVVSATVGQDLADVRQTSQNLTWTLGLTTVAAVLLGALAGHYMVRRSLRPLEVLRRATMKVSDQPLESGAVTLPGRVPETSLTPGTEVGDLGLSFNDMLDHVEDALNQREASENKLKQFAADASHELRTPLAAISGHAELAARRSSDMHPDAVLSLNRIRSEAGRMGTLVEDLLLLARLDSGDGGPTERVDMARLVTDCVTDAQVVGRDHRWSLEIDENSERMLVDGNQVRFHQAVANLLANARQHTPEGTEVTTRVINDGPTIRVEAQDNGPGIDPQLLNNVFERFTRGDTARTQNPRNPSRSTGLGLAITWAITQASGGTVSVESDENGTLFTMRLPASSQQN
ncbi:MAG: HAMP domain-containing sensor histidine kinase [Scrofimicrobium sp.]